MCYDADTSLLAWTLSYSISYYLFNRNRRYDRWNAAFIMTFTTIQLLEAGLWTTLYEKENGLNDLLTRLILLALLMQPLTQSYMGARYTGSAILYMLSMVFVGIIAWGALRLWRSKPGQFSTNPGKNGHLVWSDTKSPTTFLGPPWVVGLYLLGLFVPLLFMKDYRGIPLIVIGVATAIYSMYFSDPKEFSSYWCFTSVVYAIVALFV